MGLGPLGISKSATAVSNSGIGGLSKSRLVAGAVVDPPRTTGNPDPRNWSIEMASEHDRFLIVRMKFLDCTNYEGNKILVFEGLTLKSLIEQKLIDPHFFEGGGKYRSPIARFEPTERGWRMAERFVLAMAETV